MTVKSLLARRQARLSEIFPPPQRPWTEEYLAIHTEFLEHVLHDDGLVRSIGRGHPPRGFGVGLDERVVEYPWLFAQCPRGSTLDAGSTLNHAHILERFQPLVEELHIVTLAPEERSFPERGVSYVYADLRRLPYHDAYFDTIVSLSTLEHVGKDNSRYGGAREEADPDQELRTVLGELRRVLAPGGTILVSVPYGQREDHGWFRQFDRDDVERLTALAAPRRLELTVFAYGYSGWRKSSLRAATGARYRDFMADSRPVPDLAAAARAVACVRMEY